MDALLNLTGEEAQHFATLPSKVRTQVVERKAAVAAVTNAPHGTKAAVIARFAADLGVNPNTISRWLAYYRRNGWKGLIDTRLMPYTRVKP
jgi:hypothetical protein